MVLKTLFSDFRPFWLPNWLQHRSPKLVQNRPKSWKNRLEISTSLQDAPWPHHGTQILTKSMPKASPGRDFLGTRKTSKHVQQSATTIPTWLHHGIQGLPYGKLSSATSAVSQGFSQPASNNTMHSFPFFHDRAPEQFVPAAG